MLPNRKKKNAMLDPDMQNKKAEEDEIETLKKEIEAEQKNHESANWSNEELERSVRLGAAAAFRRVVKTHYPSFVMSFFFSNV